MDDLCLPRTKLAMNDGVIRKYARNGAVMASLNLTDIREIRCARTAEYSFSLVMTAVFTALGFVAQHYIESEGVAWTVAILCWGLALFSIFLIYGRKIECVTDHGTVAYPVADSAEEAEGFVVSVRLQLERAASESL